MGYPYWHLKSRHPGLTHGAWEVRGDVGQLRVIFTIPSLSSVNQVTLGESKEPTWTHVKMKVRSCAVDFILCWMNRCKGSNDNNAENLGNAIALNCFGCPIQPSQGYDIKSCQLISCNLVYRMSKLD